MNSAIQTNAQAIQTLNSTVGTLQTSVETLSGKVSGLETTIQNLNNTFVSVEKYNLEIGDVSKLYTTKIDEETGEEVTVTTTVTDEILALQEAMKWHEMQE